MIKHNKNKGNRVFYYFYSPLQNIFMSITRTHLLKMIEQRINIEYIILDIGCGTGELTHILSTITTTIGLDLNKDALIRAKKNSKNIDFILADVCNLPLRKCSVYIVVCASVLEFIEKIENAIEEIKLVIKKNGILLAGYPISTKLLRFIIELFGKQHMRLWDPLRVMDYNEYRKDKHTHKHRFQMIRVLLNKNFSLIKREKIPFKYLVDIFSIYECSILIKKG